MPHAQVRKPLYTSAVRRWEAYAEHLGPLRRRLARWIQAYEARLSEAEAQRARSGSQGGGGAGPGDAQGGVKGDRVESAAAEAVPPGRDEL
jgi:hypothetical protein